MNTLTIVRVVGIAFTIGGIAFVRRERENAADLDRPIRLRVVAVWIAIAVIGAAVSIWAIFAQ